MKNLKRSLDVCVVEGKPTSALWSCPRTVGHQRLFAALSGVGSVRWGSRWMLKEWSGALAPGSLVPPHLGASLITPLLSLLW